MTDRITFVVPGTPQQKRRVRTGRHTHYKDAKTKAHEDMIKLEWLRQRGSTTSKRGPAIGPVVLDIEAIYEPPKSWSETAKVDVICRRASKTSSPDVTNIAKQYEDALNGLAYEDDRQVVDVRCRKRYGPKSETIITITYEESR